MVGLIGMKKLLRHESCWNGSGGPHKMGGLVLYISFGSCPCRGLFSQSGHGFFMESELGI